jgi:hypothetical protein
MKNEKFRRLLLPIGLLLLCGSTLLKLFLKIPDFLHGFFIGLGLVFIIAGFIFQMRKKAS